MKYLFNYIFYLFRIGSFIHARKIHLFFLYILYYIFIIYYILYIIYLLYIIYYIFYIYIFFCIKFCIFEIMKYLFNYIFHLLFIYSELDHYSCAKNTFIFFTFIYIFLFKVLYIRNNEIFI